MALFNRSKKNQKSVLPDEVSQYYQAQRRERTGVAIMLGIVALVVTLLIGAALFFGGRFVYRQIAGDSAGTNDTTQQADDENQPGENSGNGNGNGQNGPGNSGTETPETPETTTPGSAGSDEPAPATPPATPPANPPSTPSTGDDTLPRTGDEGM